MTAKVSGRDQSAGEKHYLQAELEQHLGGNALLFDLLCRGTVDGLWYWNLEQPEDEWMSPEFWQLFGIDPATKSHSPSEWQDLIFPEDGELALANFERHCEDPSHPYDQVVRYRHADGSTVWVRCRGVALRDDAGKPTRMLGAHTDLTELMNANQQLDDLNAELESANQNLQRQVRETDAANAELTTFAYAASHDLKAPINTLRLLIEEVADDLGADHELTTALIVPGLGVADRARSLVEDILNYTRTVGEELAPETVDLDDLVTEVCADLGAALDDVSLDLGSLPTVHADRTQLRMLMANLVSNAAKFRAPDRPNTVTIAPGPAEPGIVSFTVSDTGIGIPDDKIDLIFDMFRRLNLASDYPGTGLGLPLCRRVVLNHHGRITVDSTFGEGTRFTITLPKDGPHV